jgi:hypothetical protein
MIQIVNTVLFLVVALERAVKKDWGVCGLAIGGAAGWFSAAIL